MILIKTNKYSFISSISFIFCALLFSCAGEQPIIHLVNGRPLGPPVDQGTKLIEVRPITLDLPEGHKLGRIEMGVVCIPYTDLVTIGGKAPVSVEDFTNVVINILDKANFNIVDATSNNPESIGLGDELILKGVVKDIKADICFPNSGFRGWKIGKGESYIKIDWNLISRPTNQIIFETTTEGSYELKDAIAYGPEKVILGSVAVATQKLIAEKNLVNLVLGSTK
jgi:hypothetical protein